MFMMPAFTDGCRFSGYLAANATHASRLKVKKLESMYIFNSTYKYSKRSRPFH